jgi:hypothetical protein
LARVPLKTFTFILFSSRHAALVSAPSLSPRTSNLCCVFPSRLRSQSPFVRKL